MHQLYLNIIMPGGFLESVEERFNRAVSELTKIASGSNE